MLDTIVSVVFPVLTIIIGGACLLLFGVTATLRATNDDQGKRIEFLEGERDRMLKEAKDNAEAMAIKDQRHADELATAKADLAALGKVVTGEVHLIAITDLLSHHHEQAVQQWDTWNNHFVHMDGTMVNIEGAMNRLVDVMKPGSTS